MNIKKIIERICYKGKKIEELTKKNEELTKKTEELTKETEVLNGKVSKLKDDCYALFHEKHEMILEDRKNYLYLLRCEILNYYKSIECDEEEKKVLEWLKNHSVEMYPYEFTAEYLKKVVEIHEDEQGWKYIIHKGKKMYFPMSYSRQRIMDYYNFLIMEQDARSPHCYFTDLFILNKQGTMVDVGAAEGILGLENIDSMKQLIVFEYDIEWIGALEKTFEPYKEKVKIVTKMAGAKTTETTISLLDALKGEDVSVLKIDVEGSEMDVLEGLRGCELKKGSQIVVCTYHTQEAEKDILNFIKKNRIVWEQSKGFLLSTWGGYAEPYFRRGLIRAEITENSTIR